MKIIPAITRIDGDGEEVSQQIMILCECHAPSKFKWGCYVRSLPKRERSAKRDAIIRTYPAYPYAR